MEIECDRGADPAHRPVSLFGAGTITFHVEGLFRTPPGWNLWVSGPPNAAKHGLAPLAGVIETDWSPYTFTMNWRFTRPGEWVRFEQDEPFCFFFPVERGVLDRTRPEIRPLSDAPELEDAFSRWSASRDAFQEHVRRTQPKAPADRWQKLYYRGVGPDGEPGPADHQAKLRPPAFERCPVQHAPSPAKPAAAPAILAAAKPNALLAQAPAPAVAPDVLAYTLRTMGFDTPLKPARSGVGLPGLPAKPAPAPRIEPPAPRRDMAAERRAWRDRLATRHAALSAASTQVPRLRDLSAEAFLDLFYATGRPVVIEGAAADWPARRQWTPATLATKVGAAEISYQGGREGAADFELAKDRHTRTMPFDRYIAQVTGGDGGNDAYVTAYNSAANGKALAPLMTDLGSLPYLGEAPGMMWIGPSGTFTPLHHDLTNNLLVQIVGTKRVTLVPPEETARIANTRHVFSDVHDIEDEAHLARFPAARAARRLVAEIGPGDALFIPVGWWHQVRSLSFSVMLTYTGFLWPNDAYLDFPAD